MIIENICPHCGEPDHQWNNRLDAAIAVCWACGFSAIIEYWNVLSLQRQRIYNARNHIAERIRNSGSCRAIILLREIEELLK